MLTDAELAALEAAWTPARVAGVLGSASVGALYEHTAGYTSAVCSSFSATAPDLERTIVDLGTGAGIPGVLLAHQLPACHLTLVDASERRLDHARRAARALGVAARVTFVHGRGDELARSETFRGNFDVAVARLLGPPSEALEQLLPLVVDRGVVVVSSADDARPLWERLPVVDVPASPAVWSELGEDHYVTVRRTGELPASLPRRATARMRAPLLGD